MTLNLLQFRPPRIALALLGIAAAIHWLLPPAAKSVQLFSSEIVAASLASVGFSVMIIAWWQFRQNNLALCPTAKTDALLTGGMFRYSRNPMYLGMVLMLAGVATLVGTVPFHLAWIAYYIIIDRVFCPYEEQKLIDAFGDEYVGYVGKVKRWF